MADAPIAAPAQPDQSVSAGRGVIFIAIAKLYFMVAGFALETLLPRILGQFTYGAYGVVVQWVSNLNNVIVTGTIQAVSRYTTEDPARADEVKAAGLRMHLYVGLPIAVAYAALAPVWAYFEHDSSKAGPMALSAVVVAAYAIYTVFVGSANGRRAFRVQATLDMTSATLRVLGILGVGALGFGVWGAIGGWVGAAVGIMVIAAVRVGIPKNLRGGDVKPMLRYLGGLALYLIIMNLIMSVDLILLKRLSTEQFLAQHPGLSGDALADWASRQADGQVAFYRAVQNLARLPYQLMLAVTFVVFPLVSRAVFEKDATKARSYVRTTLRYSLIFAGLMGVVLAANPTAMVRVMYPVEYANAGGAALAPLALGHVMFAVFTIAGTILNGAGLTFSAVAVAAVTLLAQVIVLWLGIPHAAPGSELLFVCACATSGAMLFGAAASGWLVWKAFRAFVPPLTVIRVAVAIAAVMALGHVLPAGGKIMTLVLGIGCAGVYLVVLVVTGELGKSDLAVIRRRGA